MGCRYCTISHGFDKVFEDEQIQDLSKEELLNIMDKGSCGMGSKVMIVFIKWLMYFETSVGQFTMTIGVP